mgnify:CR=1 FL=1
MNRLGAMLAAVIMMLLVLACAYLFWLQQMRNFDQLCAEKDWFKCTAAVPTDLTLYWPPGNKLILTQRLQSYFSELAGTRSSGAPQLESSLQAASAIAKVSKLYEERLHLPHLAEAYIRCAVGNYRECTSRALADLKLSIKDQAVKKTIAVENLEALSSGLRALSELYSRHNKFLIAEKAAKESIDVGTQALALASGDQDVSDRLHSQLMLEYAAHIKLLRMQNRDKEADQETLLLQQ